MLLTNSWVCLFQNPFYISEQEGLWIFMESCIDHYGVMSAFQTCSNVKILAVREQQKSSHQKHFSGTASLSTQPSATVISSPPPLPSNCWDCHSHVWGRRSSGCHYPFSSQPGICVVGDSTRRLGLQPGNQELAALWLDYFWEVLHCILIRLLKSDKA